MTKHTAILTGTLASIARTSLLGVAASILVVGRTIALDASESERLLENADTLKSTNYAEFSAQLKSLKQQSAELTPAHRQYLSYLEGWQYAYEGRYSDATQVLEAVIRDSADVTVKFRAAVTLTNVLVLARQYEKAFSQLDRVLKLLPGITDNDARAQGLAVASYLFNQVGEFGLAAGYADTLIRENTSNRSACYGQQLKLQAISLEKKPASSDPAFQSGIDACTKWRAASYANAIRTYVAQSYLNEHRADEAVQFLNDHYQEVLDAKYPRLIAQFDALLANAYREKGDAALARKFAFRAVDDGVKTEFTEPLVSAYRILYVLAKEDGDAKAALSYHEKYLAADRAYINDSSARQLAYQRVKHEVDANKLQIDGLNKQNEVLKLQRQLSQKALENIRLYIVLSTVVLGFIILWAYKTKRSQLHFMKLSRHDGLTGIFNRPHFIDQSSRALTAAKRSGQSVCIAICDLDHFKAINDNWGHATGDAVLKQAAARFAALLQKSDLVGRLGGEEFGILLVDCDMALARQRCEQLRLALADISIDSQTSQSKLSASFGIAGTASSGHEFRQLLAHADSALYRAKRSGRNCVVPHDDDTSTTPSRVDADERRLTA